MCISMNRAKPHTAEVSLFSGLRMSISKWHSNRNRMYPYKRQAQEPIFQTARQKWKRSLIHMKITHDANLPYPLIPAGLSGNIWPQSSQLAEPLWTYPGINSGISVHKLIAPLKKKRSADGEINGRTFSQNHCKWEKSHHQASNGLCPFIILYCNITYSHRKYEQSYCFMFQTVNTSKYSFSSPWSAVQQCFQSLAAESIKVLSLFMCQTG